MIAQTEPRTRSPLGLAWWKQIGASALDLLFPPHCAACHRFGSWLCEACIAQIESIHPPVCTLCGLPQPGDVHTLAGCSHCWGVRSALSGRRACAYYSGPLRQAIQEFKYQDLHILAGPLGQIMVQGWAELAPRSLPIDCLVPVPLHPARERERGYNQAALLAREMGRRLDIPVAGKVLVRTKHTRPQVGMDLHQRRLNLQGAFRCASRSLEGSRVLLIDDVCTTGSTLEAAGSALLAGGVGSVWALTLARASQVSARLEINLR